MNARSWELSEPQTLDLEGISSLSLRTIGGRFDVIAHEDPQEQVLRLTLTDLEGDPLTVVQEGTQCEIRQGNHDVARWFTGQGVMDGTNRVVLTLLVPQGTRTEAGTVSADGLVTGIHAPVRISSVTGSIISDSTRGQLGVNTASGEAIVRNHQGPLSLNSVSGEMTASGAFTEVRVNTATGDISLDCVGAIERVQSTSASGNLLLRLPAEQGVDLSVTTVSGAISVNAESFRVLGFTRRSFSPTANLQDSPPPARVQATSVSGSVSIINRTGA
ncbi:DUF4097 family beta strand repeat-containing protein [Psychromicrobium xiongbiense]|uniref:DUF4097 family beta strand repeat-containing protein n=1 Tax=Psychromicrobium xiongbiense TaxID=3051184 RepID=UPI002554F8FB|nr:DUF4097 family beta strand repeat-containing protein [Psychromicrobium sp. YIM S02556]